MNPIVKLIHALLRRHCDISAERHQFLQTSLQQSLVDSNMVTDVFVKRAQCRSPPTIIDGLCEGTDDARPKCHSASVRGHGSALQGNHRFQAQASDEPRSGYSLLANCPVASNLLPDHENKWMDFL
jgi:hypothetical protein